MEGGDDGNPEAGSGEAAITMVTEMKDIDLSIGTFREGEAVTVDWGDGTKEEVKSGVNEEADDGVLYEAYLNMSIPHRSRIRSALTGKSGR